MQLCEDVIYTICEYLDNKDLYKMAKILDFNEIFVKNIVKRILLKNLIKDYIIFLKMILMLLNRYWKIQVVLYQDLLSYNVF